MLSQRNKAGLSDATIDYCQLIWEIIGGPDICQLDVSEARLDNTRTRYVEDRHVVVLGADVLPGSGYGMPVRSRMSEFACLDHERAHAERFRLRYNRPIDLPGAYLDEAEASIRASFYMEIETPDQRDLVEDARDQLNSWLQYDDGPKDMKVESSGVVFKGECDLHLEGCLAPQSGAVLAVRTAARRQVNVCRSCFDRMVRTGEWEVEGARISRQADVAVLDRDRSPLVIVEVEKRPDVMNANRVDAWARRIHHNLVSHYALPPNILFLLAIAPDSIYAWRADANEPDAEPSEIITIDTQAYPELAPLQDAASAAEYENAIVAWFRRLQSDASGGGRNGYGATTIDYLADALARGSVEQEVVMPY